MSLKKSFFFKAAVIGIKELYDAFSKYKGAITVLKNKNKFATPLAVESTISEV